MKNEIVKKCPDCNKDMRWMSRKGYHFCDACEYIVNFNNHSTTGKIRLGVGERIRKVLLSNQNRCKICGFIAGSKSMSSAHFKSFHK